MTTPPDPHADLGRLIFQRTPYKSMAISADPNWRDQIEWDTHYGEWSFRGVNHRVAKTLRIPITVTVHNPGTGRDETYRDWLLIGYEGGSGE